MGLGSRRRGVGDAADVLRCFRNTAATRSLARRSSGMKIEINLTRATTKRIVVIAAALTVLGVGVAVGAVPVRFMDDEILTAAQLNQNFDALEGRIAALEQAQASAAREVGRIQFNPSAMCSPSTTSDAYVPV